MIRRKRDIPVVADNESLRANLFAKVVKPPNSCLVQMHRHREMNIRVVRKVHKGLECALFLSVRRYSCKPFMTSWHKEEEEASRRRATKRDFRDVEPPTHL